MELGFCKTMQSVSQFLLIIINFLSLTLSFTRLHKWRVRFCAFLKDRLSCGIMDCFWSWDCLWSWFLCQPGARIVKSHWLWPAEGQKRHFRKMGSDVLRPSGCLRRPPQGWGAPHPTPASLALRRPLTWGEGGKKESYGGGVAARGEWVLVLSPTGGYPGAFAPLDSPPPHMSVTKVICDVEHVYTCVHVEQTVFIPEGNFKSTPWCGMTACFVFFLKRKRILKSHYVFLVPEASWEGVASGAAVTPMGRPCLPSRPSLCTNHFWPRPALRQHGSKWDLSQHSKSWPATAGALAGTSSCVFSVLQQLLRWPVGGKEEE